MVKKLGTVNSRCKKGLNLQIYLHKASFLDDRFLNSVHKPFLKQTTLNLRKTKRNFLFWEFTVFYFILLSFKLDNPNCHSLHSSTAEGRRHKQTGNKPQYRRVTATTFDGVGPIICWNGFYEGVHNAKAEVIFIRFLLN